METRRALNSNGVQQLNHHHHSRKEEVLVRWKAPPLGWLTLNCDGATKGSTGPVGGGGLIRNTQGELVQDFNANFGICSSFKAEVKANLIGIQLAKELGIHHLIIQMDNQACIQMLSSEEYGGGECHHLLNQCRKLLSDNQWEVQLD
ncbi:hypothetical protein RDABS01_016047 [Bienertia sinuspersici]